MAPVPTVPATDLNFDGVGKGFVGPAGAYSVDSAPPASNGAVGPNHYFQVVNAGIAIFNKQGTAVYGPVPTNTLWAGFGGGCQMNNDGDATVHYDRAADRFVIGQFSISTPPTFIVWRFPNPLTPPAHTTATPFPTRISPPTP
jgi:hypothetical protein